MPMLTLRFDLRAPAFAPVDHATQYRELLEMSEWADRVGFDAVTLSEHHGVEDGFMSAPLLLAGAVAGRTRRVRISIAALLVPLHDPLRLAEDLAALDLVSGGRASVVAGLGYRPEEFEMFGVDRSRRGALLEEAVEVLRQAWTGEEFTWKGRRCRVTPRPASQPHPPLMIGGSAPASARRAARLRLPFMPPLDDPELVQLYLDEAARVGYDQPFVMTPSNHGFVHVTHDPERDWERIVPHAMHEATTYASWQVDDQRSSVTTYATTPEDLAHSGVYRVVTPEQCLELAAELGDLGGMVFHPLMGGLNPALAWESLELFAAEVLPKLRPAGVA